jgi:dephospho-CoA kinase
MKPFIVGVTGHIGGGKSKLLDQLKALGVFVIQADEVAKEILYTEQNKVLLIEMLGDTILDENNAYNFKEIRRIIFSDYVAKNKLEVYLTDKVWKEIKTRIDTSKDVLVFVENAILFEQGWSEHFNLIICVYCDLEEAIKRVTETRDVTREEVLAIISSQMPIEKKISLSDFSINTTNFKKKNEDGSIKFLRKTFRARYRNLI